MPVTFRYDERSGIVLTTAKGIVSFEDLMSHIEAKAHMDLSGAAELFDARDLTLDLSLAQMRRLAHETEIQLGGQMPLRPTTGGPRSLSMLGSLFSSTQSA